MTSEAAAVVETTSILQAVTTNDTLVPTCIIGSTTVSTYCIDATNKYKDLKDLPTTHEVAGNWQEFTADPVTQQ